MWLKYNATDVQLFVSLLLLLFMCHYNVRPTSAAIASVNMAQLKNQQQQQQQHQQLLGQVTTTTTSQHQTLPHHNHHVLQRSQSQHQLSELQHQQKTTDSSNSAAHPTNNNKLVHSTNVALSSPETEALPPASSSLSSSASVHLPASHYAINDKDAAMQEVLKQFNQDKDLNDPYQLMNELQSDGHVNTYEGPPPPSPLMASVPIPAASSLSGVVYPWNLYDRPLPPPTMPGLFSHIFNPFDNYPTPYPVTPRYMPFMSYPQPVYVPYPYVMPTEMFYPGFSSLPPLTNDYEESMARGAGAQRRPSSVPQHTSSYSRNSPIYYVRLPPTPYMFLPNPTPLSGYSTMLPFQSLPTFPAFSPVFNVPVNFLANGKPSNIYQMSSPPQDPLQFTNVPSSFNTRPPPPPPLPSAYRPGASHNYFNPQPPTASSSNYVSYPASSTSPASSSSSSNHQDSKLTSLKNPYYFNGRPEDIYVLPNNFNPMYSSENSYY